MKTSKRQTSPNGGNKYERLIADLESDGKGNMKCFGNSMLPILTNPSVNEYRKQASYEFGDIVFCKVKGRYIDAHMVKAKEGDRYLIANNHGHLNGWTRTIYGRVVRTTDAAGKLKDVG